MSEEEKRHVLRFARDPNSAERIASSLAPSIYGQKHTKRALAMAMFGGCPKNVDGKHRIRGDVAPENRHNSDDFDYSTVSMLWSV